MSKILFISAHAPTEKYPQAGQKIALHYLKNYLDAATVDVIVIANQIEIDTAEDLRQKCGTHLYTYPISKFNKISSCFTNFNTPLKFATRKQTKVLQKLQKLLTTNTYKIIHFEYSHAAVYLDLIQSQIDPNLTQTVISIHDIVSQSFLRKAATNPILGIEVARIFRYEKSIYSTANHLWVLSKKDRDILTSLFSIPEAKITIKPPQLSSFVYYVKRHSEIETKSLLFWAAMNRPENEQAIITFVKDCFQKLLQNDPEYKLYIVGSNPSQKVQKLASSNIIVTGFVEDPTPFFAKAAIGIVPLLEGAGIKLKTLEMLEAGLPVISTSIGAEGVDSSVNDLIVSDDFREWVNLILEGSKNPGFPRNPDSEPL
jgi:polysaccharide biosynthesis protein PslH